MKRIIFILIAIFILSCEKDEVKPNRMSATKDTVATFFLWGNGVKTIKVSFFQNGKTWSKDVQYPGGYTSDNPYNVYLNISPINTNYVSIIEYNGQWKCPGLKPNYIESYNYIEIKTCGILIE